MNAHFKKLALQLKRTNHSALCHPIPRCRLVWLFVLVHFQPSQCGCLLFGVIESSEVAQTLYYGGANPALNAGANAGVNVGSFLNGYASPVVQAAVEDGIGSDSDVSANAVKASADLCANAGLSVIADVGAGAGCLMA